jgi:hypothetical protein
MVSEFFSAVGWLAAGVGRKNRTDCSESVDWDPDAGTPAPRFSAEMRPGIGKHLVSASKPEEPQMPAEQRELYNSPNGDRWLLSPTPDAFAGKLILKPVNGAVDLLWADNEDPLTIQCLSGVTGGSW